MNFSESIKEEIWKDIEGTMGAYQVSDMGRVKSFKYIKPKILKNSGIRYHQVCLWIKKKIVTKRINRLVLEAFVGPAPQGFESAHLNGIKTDNRLANLKWCSHLENCNHPTQWKDGKHISGHRLSIQQIKMVRALRKDNKTYKHIAELIGVETDQVIKIVKRISHASVK